MIRDCRRGTECAELEKTISELEARIHRGREDQRTSSEREKMLEQRAEAAERRVVDSAGGAAVRVRSRRCVCCGGRSLDCFAGRASSELFCWPGICGVQLLLQHDIVLRLAFECNSDYCFERFPDF